MRKAPSRCNWELPAPLEGGSGTNSWLADGILWFRNPPVFATRDMLCPFLFITYLASSMCATWVHLTHCSLRLLSLLTGVSYLHALHLAPTDTMVPRLFLLLGPLSGLHVVRCSWSSCSSIHASVQYRNWSDCNCSLVEVSNCGHRCSKE